MNRLRMLPVRMTATAHLLLALTMLGVFVVAGSGCASKKKTTKTQPVSTMQQDDPGQLLKAKGQLLEILNDDGSIPLNQKETTLNAIKAQKFQDPEINDLIGQAERKIAELYKKQQDEQAKLITEAKETERSNTMEILYGFFDDLVKNDDYSKRDLYIMQALKLFTNEDVPVLVIISEQGGIVDYDEPTTILRYLEYLSDTRNNANLIKSIKVNEEGFITELELIKK